MAATKWQSQTIVLQKWQALIHCSKMSLLNHNARFSSNRVFAREMVIETLHQQRKSTLSAQAK
jgi:hypothetical protein